jgi:methyl-accepting chemotaxis protein
MRKLPDPISHGEPIRVHPAPIRADKHALSPEDRPTMQTPPLNAPPRAAFAQRGDAGSGFGTFFRYHGWLAPGVRLFRRISFPAKAGWVALAFMLPLAVLLYFMVGSTLEQVETTRSERAGLRYARPLLELIPLAQLRRRAYASNAPDAVEHQAKVKSAFEAVTAQQSELGRAMDADKSYAALRQVHEALLQAPTAANADDTFAAHTDYIKAAMALLRTVADGSQLTLDPEADTYHLQNIALARGPRMAENLARLRGMGGMALATKDSKELSTRRRDLMVKWMAVHDYIEEDVENSFGAVVAATPEVDKLVDMKAADAAALAFESAVKQQILGVQIEGDVASYLALGNAAVDQASQLNAKLLNRLDEQLQARIERLRSTMWLKLTMAGLCIALAGYLMLAFYKVMLGGLNEVSGHLRAIAKGDLGTAPLPWGQDEAAQLMLTVAEMQGSLRRIIGSVLAGAQQVQTASEEIAAAALDLSGRTEQTAASLQQTASSMEEIAGTVKQTADTAVGATAIVQSNASAATRGGEVIAQVVCTMQGIQTSSNKIGEIIGVIDSIAFQTNILALNAAVEAARAGEQGRGFAVVASEVRALAGRSAAAAREIKSLIGASIEQVQSGSRVAAEAGATMGEIVGNAGRIASLMDEIATATREQSGGIGLVGSAVSELDRSTQQNAALVEQTSAASSALSEQAQRLTSEAGFFRL